MWRRVRERLLTVAGITLMIAWLVSSPVIAVGIVLLTGIDLHGKAVGELALMIFLLPIGIVVAVDEFIVRPCKFGPPPPARHRRDELDLDQVRELDRHLKRDPGGDTTDA